MPTQLELKACPTGLDKVSLAAPLQPLIIQVDCKKKVISVRGFDRQTDSEWEMMPDGSFTLTTGAGTATLNNDGSGKACSTALTVTLSGQADCSKDRDRVLVDLDAIWSFGQPQTTGVSSAIPGAAPTCQLSSGCYFHSSAKLHQCQ